MGRIATALLVAGVLSFGASAAAEPGDSRPDRRLGIGGTLGAQVFTLSGVESDGGGLQLDFLQLHIEAALSDRVGLGIWIPVSEMLVGAAASELETVEIRSSLFVLYRPWGDRGLFAGPGLGLFYVSQDDERAVGPEIGARLGWEISSRGRGFSTTIGVHPYWAYLPLSSSGSASLTGIGFELGFHYWSRS